MGTLKNTAYALATRHNRPSDFGYVQLMEFEILTLSAMLARREYEKTRKFPNELVTKVSCLGVEEVDAAECCDVTLGCKVLRTTYKIPSTINIKDHVNFISVSGMGKGTVKEVISYNYIAPARVGFIDSKFGEVKAYTIFNNYIYLFGDKKLEYIDVVAAFSDIRDLAAIKDCFGVNCFDTASEVPVPDHYIPIIMDAINQRYNPQWKNSEVEITKDE